MAHLQLTDVVQRYGGHTVVNGIGFRIEAGAIACLLGPSGCGKTTLLRCIAGFEDVAAGSIVVDGETLSAPGFTLAPERRRIGMVFQDYALFPHLSVAGNVAFGLPAGDGERRRRVAAMLDLVGLAGQGERYPHELSGGQQQRVALARALAPAPRLVLLDEPFSNLDVDLRERLSLEVRQILKQAGTTAVLVTHDQHEAFAMADEIGVMHQGRIEQWDTPHRLYHQPASRFVADFVGQGALVAGTVLAGDRIETALGLLAAATPIACGGGSGLCLPGSRVDVLLRPDDVVYDEASPLRAAVEHKAFRGAEILYALRLADGTRVLSLVPSRHDRALGEKIGIRLEADHVVAFRQEAPRP